jgi:hypothetical protein
MTQYQFHWWPSRSEHLVTPSVRLEAASRLEGAALALRQFVQAGCDIAAPAAHIDLKDGDGSTHTLLVEEVLDWLSDPHQAAFVQREGLAELLG